jgi:hypothetical protein
VFFCEVVEEKKIPVSLCLLPPKSVYGYSSARPSIITGFDGRDSVEYHRVGHSSLPLPNVVDVASVVTRPLPPAPLAPTIALHWLAVEGVQPHTPQNPTPISSSSTSSMPSSSTASTLPIATGSSLQLTREEQLLFGFAVSAVREGALLDSATLSGVPCASDRSSTSLVLSPMSSPRTASVVAVLGKDRAAAILMPHFAKFIKEEVSSSMSWALV